MINFRKKKPEEAVEKADVIEVADVIDVADEANEAEAADVTEVADVTEEDLAAAEEKFMQEVQAFAKGKGVDDAQLQESIDFIRGIRELKKDEFPTVEAVDLILRGFDFERAAAEARIAGELEGRNKQIEEVYMRPAEGDGLPHLGGSGSVRRTSRSLNSIFDLAREA